MTRGTMRRPALPPELDPRRPRQIRSPLGRLSLGAIAMLSIVVLSVSSIGWAAYRQFSSALNKGDLLVDGDRPEVKPGDMNILLLGDDSRAGTNGEFGDAPGVRSDTTIIAHLDANGSATLLSFPRDMLLAVDSDVDGAPADGKDKLTNILTYAGVSGLVSTLENLTGLRVDHYVSIDLDGFRKMTDAVGGVTVCVTRHPDGTTRNLNDEWSQWHGQLGDNHLDGNQALAFVRTRHSLGDERLRIARQQQFLSKLLAKATSAGVLTNPVRLNELINAVGESLEVDKGLTDDAMIALASRLGQLSGVAFHTVPTHVPTRAEGASDDFGTIGSHGNVLFYDPLPLAQLLAPLRPDSENGDLGNGATTTAPAVPPSQVVVSEVLNGTGRSGLAGQTVTDLAALGFGGTPEAGTGDEGQMMTEVRYPPGQAAAAATLAGVIPGAVTVEDPDASGSGLVLVLGVSFEGVTGGRNTSGTSGGSGTGGSGTGSTAALTAAGSGTAAGTGTAPAAPPPAAADTSCTA